MQCSKTQIYSDDINDHFSADEQGGRYKTNQLWVSIPADVPFS
jgi:hypothetical protein